MKKYLLALFVLLTSSGLLNVVNAQSLGDYRTRAAGAWNGTNVWEIYQIFGIWQTTTGNPSNTNGAITILHPITIGGGLAINADQITISSGGSLTISDGTLNLYNGSGNDLTLNNGTLTLNNALSAINSPSGSASISATSGTINLSNGTIAAGVTINTYNSTAVNITQASSSNLTLNGILNNYSSNAVWNASSATFTLGTNGFLYNGNGGVITITGSGSVNLGSNSATSRTGIFTNLGTLTKTTASTLNINCSSYDDNGLFQLTTVASTVYINSGGDLFGTFNASVAGSNFFYVTAAKNFYSGLTLSGAGAHHFNATSTFLISGTNAFNFASTINFNTPCAIPADINIPGGILNCNKGVSFDGPGYSIFTYSPQINVGAGGSFSTSTADTLSILPYSGTTALPSTLTANNNISINGPMSIQAICLLTGASTVNFTGNYLSNFGRIQTTSFNFNGSSLQTISGYTGRMNTVVLNNPNHIQFVSNQNILNGFTFTKGKALVDDKIFIAGTASITGASSSSYFAGEGFLKRTLLASTSYSYPVGTLTDYLPATITTAATFVADTIWTRLESYDFNTNYDTFLYPIGSSVSSHVADPVWRIAESTAAGSNFTSIRLQWNKLNEKYLFNRALCGIVRNSGSTWNTPTTAAASGSDPYTRTSAALTLGGSKQELFGVADNAVNYLNNELYSNTQSRSSCAGGSFTFTFYVNDSTTIAAGNVFTAQLSNNTGSFASPVSIGSVTARGGRNLTVTIPAGTPVGDYSIRMISSNPLLVEDKNYTNYYNQRVSVQANCYCSGPLSTVACTNYYILNVKLGNINRFSGCESQSGLAYSSFGIENYAYYDYSPMTATLIRGSTASLSVTTNAASSISVWVDYNRNGIYEASEWTQVSAASTANIAATVSLAIPITASLGLTGMRIRTRSAGSNSSADACTLFGSGETEEYFVYIADNFAHTSHTPTSNNDCVSSSISPTISYNSAIKFSSVTNNNYYLQGSISGIKPAVLSGGGTSTITINPTQNFEPGEVISVLSSGANIMDTSRQTVGEYCYQFTAAASVGPKTFVKNILNGSGSSVSNSYSADINNDGFVDVVDVNSSVATSYIVIHKGNGNGTFQTPTYIYTGGVPYSAAIADYDRDGDMDIAVAYSSKYSIDIYYNSGTGTFTGPTSVSTSHRARNIVSFYVMDNEAPSILTANTNDSTVSVIQNFGNGTFTEISRRSVGAPVQSVVAGDFNLNGILDVAASCNNNKIVILEFVTRKSLTIRSIFSCGGSFPLDLKTADFNGDGDLDLVWANFSSSNLGYVRGTTGLGFDTTNTSTLSTGLYPYKIALADFDGDCDIDISSTNASTADFKLFQNSSGGFTNYDGPKGNSAAGYVLIPAAADFDEDGDIDLVASSVAYSAKYFLENATYTIQTNGITGPLCNNANTTVSWTVSDSLPATNLFYIQLSDASGSFASPIQLDTLSGTFSGSTSVIIPTVTAGTGYRIRVVSNLPGVVSSDNGANIAIGASPSNPNINFACSGTSTVLSATGGTTYTWSPSTYLSSATGSPVTATPAVTQIITLIARDVAGCASSPRTASVGPTCYCYPNYANSTCTNDYISSVVFNTLSYNSSNCGGNDNNTTINYYTTTTPNVATDVNRLSNYSLSLTAGTANPEGFGVWIDYNKDGDYDDGGEFVYASPSTANQTFTTSINIPGTAALGVTRMRVMIVRGSLVTALQNCSISLNRGETQDFYIRINGCTPPTAYTVSGGGTICTAQSTSINLSNSASGVTYTLYRNAVSTGTTLAGTGSGISFSGVSTAGTYSIYGTTTLGCTLKMQDSVSVSIVSNPSSANAGSDQTRCGLTSATLTANTPTSGTGAWTIVSESGGSFSSTSNPTATFTAAAGSTNTLRWTISSSPCVASFDEVTISFPFNPTTANAGPDQLSLCGLTSATLAANTATIGTGAWTVITGTGGSFSNANAANSTFIGSAGTTYTLRWTITNSTCTPSTDEVSIAFPRNPTTANAGASQTLCGTSTATLAANTPTSGTGIWTIFSGAGGSLSNSASPSSTFNGVAGNTYVLFWTISNAPCTASADSLVIAFPRNPSTSDAGPDQTLCGITTATLAANTPNFGSGVWSKVSGAGGSFSNASSPTSTFTGTAGINYTLRWTISNSPCTASSDQVSINFALNPTVALAGNDTNICNGSTINLKANTAAVGSGTWSISSGSCTITNNTSPTTTANNFSSNTLTTLVWSISNGVCPTSRDTVKINSNSTFCAATLADFTANSTTTCTGTSITFTDLSSNATGWNWNFGANASPATALTQGPHTVTYSTTGLKTVALTASGPGGSNTATKSNYISVITTPATPTGISGTAAVCAGTNSVIYSISAVATATGYVWLVPTGASIVAGSGSTSITVNYSASAVSGNISVYASNACGNSSNATLAISVSQVPTAALAGPDQLTLCGTNSATLAANAPAVGNGSWSIVSGGSGTFSNSTSPVSTFTGTAGNTYTLRWTISNAPCSASTDDVVVTFNQNPSTSNAGPDKTNLCGLSSTTLAGNTPSIGSGNWTVVSGTGGSFSNASIPNSVFVGLPGNSYTLRWTISNAPCAVSNDDMLVAFPLNPTVSNAGIDQTLCGSTSATLSANTALVGTGVWTIVSGSGGSFASANSATSIFNGVSGTTYTLRWTISNSPCTASFDDVTISLPKNPSLANAGIDQINLCGTSSTSLAATIPTDGTGTWSIVSGSGGSVVNSTSATSLFNGILGNNYTLRWTVANSPCPSNSDDVLVTFNQNPTLANAGPDQQLCGQTSTTLTANPPTNGSGNWTILSGTGGSFSSTTTANSSFNGLAGNSYTLRWTISNTPCGNSTDDVLISFPQNPSVALAGNDQQLCGVTSAILAGNTPSVGNGNWSIVSGTGGSFVAASSPTTTFNGTAGNTYTLRWTISNAACGISTDEVVVSFPQTPSISNAGFDQSLCGANTTALSANSPLVGIGSWTLLSGSGGTFSNSASATSNFTGIAGNNYVLRWTISNSICVPSSDDVSISFPQNPSASNAGLDQNICGATSLSLSANAAVIGTGLWSIVSGIGGSFSAPTNPFSSFNGIAGNTYTLQWTISNSPCNSSSDNVSISFLQLPSTSFAGNDTTICNGSSLSLSASIPTIGSGTWTILSGTSTISNVTSASSSANGFLANGSTSLIWTVNAGNSCPESRDTVIITSNTAVCIITLADFTVDTTKACINSTLVFSDASNQATSWNWNFGAGANPPSAIGIGPHSVSYSSSGFKTISLTVNGPGGTDTKTKSNYVEVISIPGAATAITGAQTVCQGQNNVSYSTLAIANAVSYNWILPSGAFLNSSSQNNITVDFGPSSQSGNLTVQGENGCGSGSSSNLAITVNNLPDAAGLISGNDTLCSGAQNIVFSIPLIANATSYEWQLSSGIASSTGSTTTLSPQISVNLSPGIGTGSIRVVGKNACGTGDSSAVFSFYEAPFPSAAGILSGANVVSACLNQTGIQYTVPSIANASGYSWSLPPLATITSGANTNSILVDFSSNSSSGNVTVSGTNFCGTGISSSLAVNFVAVPNTEICYATVDSATVQCLLYWQRPVETYVDSFVIYSDPTGGTNLSRIAALKNTTSVSTNFLDPFSNPIINAVAYQIATKDSCNNQLSLSATVVHKTINLNGTLGWSGVAKLYWNEYLGVTDTGRYYSVLRDTIGTGPFDDTLATHIPPASIMNFTDITSFQYINCRYVIVMDFDTDCDPTQRIMASRSTSRSNIKNRAAMIPDALADYTLFYFSAQLYPNPAKGSVNLVLNGIDKNYNLSISNLLGQTVMTEQLNTSGTTYKKEISLNYLSPGIYFVTVESENSGKKVMKLQVE